MSDLHLDDTVKMVQEALSCAECAMLNFYPEGMQRDSYARIIARMIAECKRQRPTGPDGKHGNLHTAECGCDDRLFCGKTIEGYMCAMLPNHPGRCYNAYLDY